MSLARVERLRTALEEGRLQAVALNPGPTLTYLTGVEFHLMERPVVLLVGRQADPVLVLPELEALKVDQIPYPVQAFTYGEDPTLWPETFRQALGALDLDGGRIGLERLRMRLLEYELLRHAAPGADFEDAGGVLSGLRVRKDDLELASMVRAVDIAQRALQACLPLIRIGMQEQDLAAELVMQLLRHGSQPELPFQPIVSGGPNSANPHASPTGRALQAGDMLVIDWGARVDGYISDLTRTFALAEVDPELERVHAIVQQANQAGREAGKPGAPCAAVDRAARAVIEAAGYARYFTHRTGHGIGMEAHEDPYMRGDNTQALEPGMAYTVEPGIYLPGRNGVRIEDDMIMRETGAESLSDLPRSLRVVG